MSGPKISGLLAGLLAPLKAGGLWQRLSRRGDVEAQLYANSCERSRLLDHKTHQVSILVTNWNGEQEIAAFLQSYAKHHDTNEAELVILDHASSDASRELIRDWMKTLPIKLICCDRNQRYSVANNLAQAYADGNVLIFANNDLVFDEPVIPALRAMMENPEIGLAGVTLYYPDADGARSDKLQHRGISFAPDSNLAFMRPYNIKSGSNATQRFEETAAVTTALAACRRADFDAVGGFLEDYDYGFEDVDLCLKLHRQLGRRNVICTGLAAIHKEFGSQRRQSKRLLLDRRQANALVFRNHHNRFLTRAVMQSQLHQGFWHLKPLQMRVPQSMAPALSKCASPAGSVELLSMAAGAGDKQAGFCGIWLVDDPQELRLNPAPRSTLAVALVDPGSASEWEEVLGQHQIDLLLCDKPEDQQLLKEHSGTCLAEARVGTRPLTSDWIDWLLGMIAAHLAKPAIAIKAAMPDPNQSKQADLELVRELGGALRERGYRVRIDFPKQWKDLRLYMDDVTVTLRGNERYHPETGALNLLWLIDADHPASDEELNEFGHVFTISSSEAGSLRRRLSTGASALKRQPGSNPAAALDQLIRERLPQAGTSGSVSIGPADRNVDPCRPFRS